MLSVKLKGGPLEGETVEVYQQTVKYYAFTVDDGRLHLYEKENDIFIWKKLIQK